jgi:hypothetical protein
MRPLLVALVAGSILSISLVSHAETDDEKAKAAFEFGKAWFNEGKYAEAADAFRRAYKLKPSWKLFYNIGQCEAAAKRYELALEAFEKYLSQGGDDVPKERQGEVRTEIKRLRDLVGYIEVDAPDGAVVIVDGIERDRVPLHGPIAIAAGVNHEVVVERKGTVLLTRTIRIGGDKTIRILAEETKQEDRVDHEGNEPRREGEKVDGLRLAGWMTAGLGGALLVASAATGGKAMSMNGDLKDVCPDNECPSNYWDDMDKMHNLGVATNVMLVFGSIALATGTTMIIFSYRDDEAKGEIAALPLAGPEFIGASIQGRF